MPTPPPESQRLLGFWDLFFIAVGQIVGAGIIALTGVAIGMTGPGVILAFPAAALLVLIVAVPVLAAGATLPTTGAYYVWTSRLAGGPIGSFVLMLIALASISLSLYGSSFGLYLNPIFPILSVNGWGILIVASLFTANLFGLRIASGAQMILVLILVSALGIYAGFAAPKIDPTLLSPLFPKGVIGFASAVFLLKFATGGAHLIVGLGGETRDASRTIPRVMIAATLVVALLYSAVALASVGVLPWKGMIDQPLTVAGAEFLPGWAFGYFVVGGAGVAISTTLNAQFIQLPRNFMVASWDGLLPEHFGRLNRYGAPHWILAAMLVLGIGPLVAGLDLGEIARATTIAASLPSVFVFYAISRIEARYPDYHAESRFKLNRFWNLVCLLISEIITIVGIVLLASDLSASTTFFFAGGIALAFAYYPLRRAYLARRGINLVERVTDSAILAAARAISETDESPAAASR